MATYYSQIRKNNSLQSILHESIREFRNMACKFPTLCTINGKSSKHYKMSPFLLAWKLQCYITKHPPPTWCSPDGFKVQFLEIMTNFLDRIVVVLTSLEGIRLWEVAKKYEKHSASLKLLSFSSNYNTSFFRRRIKCCKMRRKT